MSSSFIFINEEDPNKSNVEANLINILKS